jgi:hypothetical protein
MTDASKILIGRPEGREPVGRPRRRWGIILKQIIGIYGLGVWIRFIWHMIGAGGGLM